WSSASALLLKRSLERGFSPCWVPFVSRFLRDVGNHLALCYSQLTTHDTLLTRGDPCPLPPPLSDCARIPVGLPSSPSPVLWTHLPSSTAASFNSVIPKPTAPSSPTMPLSHSLTNKPKNSSRIASSKPVIWPTKACALRSRIYKTPDTASPPAEYSSAQAALSPL